MSFKLKPVLKKVSRVVPDSIYLKSLYKRVTGKKLDLSNPKTFSEKIQWLKLRWHPDILTQCADKYSVRDFVVSRGCAETLNELIGVYDRAEDIDWDALPNAFVLKVTHGCKQNIICPDKSKLDRKFANRLLNRWLKNKTFRSGPTARMPSAVALSVARRLSVLSCSAAAACLRSVTSSSMPSQSK